MKYKVIDTQMNKVTKFNVCPICGKPDWCYTSVSTYSIDGRYEDFEFVSCRRIEGDSFSGLDGKYYSFNHTSKDNVHIYEEVSQKARRYEVLGISTSVSTPRDYIVKIAKETIKPEVYLAPIEKRDAVYREFLELLKLEDDHRKNLYDEGWDHELIESSMLRSLPPSGYDYKTAIENKKKNTMTDYDVLVLNQKNLSRKKICEKLYLKFGDLEGIPGFYMSYNKYDNSNAWDCVGKRGMLIPQYNVDGLLFTVRLRVDNVTRNKYKAFSSYYEDLKVETETQKIYVNSYDKGSRCQSEVSYLFPDYKTPFLCITEGGKKQRVVVNEKKIGCANVPGVSSFSSMIKDIDSLKDMGIKYIIIAYDADKKNNTHVLKAEIKLIEAMYKAGFEIFVAEWPESYGKGIDDVLLGGNDIRTESLIDYLDNMISEE